MWRRGGLGLAAAVVALGLLAGCGGGGDENARESFTPEELSAIQAATDNVAVYCTNQIVARSTGRTITGGPQLADAEAGIDTLARLAGEKPEALWEPEVPTPTAPTTETTGQAGSGTTGTDTTETTGTDTTTGTATTGPATGPRTLAQTLADLQQPVRAGCGASLSARLASALAQLAGTATVTAPSAPASTVTETTPPASAPTAPPGTAPTAPAPAPAPPTPAALSGAGPGTSEVQLSHTGPLVATARYAGTGTFVVRLEPTSGGPGATLFERLGPYAGQTLLAQPQPGSYRVRVEASGRWSLRLAQPEPSPSAQGIPGAFTGTGARVVPVQATEALRAQVAGQHRGRLAFRVALVGYGTSAGTLSLFDQSGRFQGQTVSDIPAGHYLLAVQADGSWTVTFSPAGG
jgi:hypothetical protein